LNEHIEALVLVGAQAVYLHTGDTDLAVAEYTTDADLSISPDDLADNPLIENLLKTARFNPGDNPGSWISHDGIVIDIMVAEELAGRGTRSADLRPHDKSSARRAKGLEGSLVDRDRTEIGALDPLDERTAIIWVAGPAALLVAKTHKIYERIGHPNRISDKDALDVYRLLQSVDTEVVVERLEVLKNSDLARSVTMEAIGFMPELFGSLDAPGVKMAVRAVGLLELSDTVAQSLVALVGDLFA
jgi:hypothetical protein